MKKILIVLLCTGLLMGCEDSSQTGINETQIAETLLESTGDYGEQTERIGNIVVDNSSNEMKVPFEKVERALSNAFSEMNAELDLETVSISSMDLSKSIHVNIDFTVGGKEMEATGSIDMPEPENELKLWDIFAKGKQGEHYYWLSPDNLIMEDNSIRRNGDNCALYDFNTEEILKRRSDLPKGNLANVSPEEFSDVLKAALLDIGYGGEISEVEIESRNMGLIYFETYFYANGKHLAADFTKYSDNYLEMSVISLYEDPDYYYWVSPNITVMLGISLHDFQTDEEIKLEDLDYSNYNSALEQKTKIEVETEEQDTEFIELSAGKYIVGEDISDGKYDIIGIESGVVKVCSPGKDYGDIVSEIIEAGETVYANVTLENGYTVEIVNGGKIRLQPK